MEMFLMKRLLSILLTLGILAACSGRVPSPQTAHDKTQKHFQKYGKRYKDSDFGQHKLERVEISSVDEIQKGLAEAEAYAYLADGGVYKVRVILRKKTFGWKVISWETLGKA
jgi:hypothetical protein